MPMLPIPSITNLSFSHPYDTTTTMSSIEPSAPSAASIAINDTHPKAPADPAAARAAPLANFFRKTRASGEWRRGVACFDFLLRFLAFGAFLSATVAMGTAEETLPFFTEHYQFHASYSNFPSLVFFVVANAVATAYLALSLPCSLVGFCRPHAAGPRLLLLVFDVVMIALTAASAASAADVVYLAHEGNDDANWVAICLRFQDFCQQSSGAVVASFVGVVIFMLLVAISAVVLRKH